MTKGHDIQDILDRIDGVLEAATTETDGVVDTVHSTKGSRLARPIAEATGLDTIVVRGDAAQSDEAQAIAAALAARDAFLPGAVAEDLGGEL